MKIARYFLFICIFFSIAASGQELPSASSPVGSAELVEAVAAVSQGLAAARAPGVVVECPMEITPSHASKLSLATIAGSSCYEATREQGLASLVRNDYSELPIGQHRLMRRDRNNFYQSGDYLLRRVGSNKYQAVLNLNVTSAANNGDLASAMMNRIRGCIDIINPYLKGSNGKELEIAILTPEEVQAFPQGMPRPAEVNINVTKQAKNYRGNANEFGSNFDCKTIGHELLHHLGLCDEYHEDQEFAASVVTSNGTSGPVSNNGSASDEWSCRQVTHTGSYMRNITESFLEVVPHHIRCGCDNLCKASFKNPKTRGVVTSESVWELAAQDDLSSYCSFRNRLSSSAVSISEGESNPTKYLGLSEGVHVFEYKLPNFILAGEVQFSLNDYVCDCRTDPSGKCERKVKNLIDNVSTARPALHCRNDPTTKPMIGLSGETRLEGDTMVINSPGVGSLLTEGQFDKILSGNCKGGSLQYERCAAFSNIGKTIPDPANPGQRIPNPECNVPPECNDDNYYLHSGSSLPAVTNQ